MGEPAVEPQPEQKPAVYVKHSVTNEFIVCSDCGRKQKTLKRHIATAHGITPAEYRTKWNLSHDHRWSLRVILPPETPSL